MNKKRSNDLVSNRKALHDYEILESYEVGIVLKGAEVKSLRNAQASLDEAYVRVVQDELWLVGAYIAPYAQASLDQPDERRDRKLLAKRREIDRLRAWTQEKGQTLVPLGIYLKQGRIKVRIGRARGKKHYDKRAAIKEREEKRRMDRLIKEQ